MGREPTIPFETAATCGYGWPAVIRCEAFDSGGQPNPNRYYLTCPYLRKVLSRLEDSRMIAELEERLRDDDALAAAVRQAQKRHADEWRLGAGRRGAKVAAPRIAAAAGDLSIKCLHAHAAYYLTHPHYPLGSLLLERIGGFWCEDDRCGSFLSGPGPGNGGHGR